MLLVRFMRVAGNAPDPATELFAWATLIVAVAVVFLVAACLIAVPSIPARRRIRLLCLMQGGERGGFGRGCCGCNYDAARAVDLSADATAPMICQFDCVVSPENHDKP
uniref:Uncharacterized protein n=1 Tax=Leersia perrieri TaxID=77586 RepID=A0A0D9WN00_9ORYZ